MLALFLLIFELKADLSPQEDVPCTISNCQSCDTENNCIKCDSNYGFKKENGKNVCSKCIGDCTECYENYLICEKCSKGPLISPGICGKCDEGFGYLNGKCEQEPKNCYNYEIINGVFECDECRAGYYPKDNNFSNCVPCSTENCVWCDAPLDVCYSCETGFKLIRNDDTTIECRKCLESNCDDCYDDISKCSECLEGYGQVFDENNQETGTCRRCANSKCRDCRKNYLKCELVKNFGWGYGIDENGDVIRCPDGCYCNPDNASYCSSCFNDYYGEILDNDGKSLNQCKKCQEYCIDCNSNASECRECIREAGQIEFEGSLKCVLTPLNKGIVWNEKKFECNDYYGILFDNNGNPTDICSECPPHCIACSKNSNNCTYCESGYGPVLDKNGKNLGICEKCTGLCNKCENDYTKCSECGYSEAYPDMFFGPEIDENGKFTGNCISCGKGCVNCYDNAKICDACENGYRMIEDENGNPTGECSKCTIPYCTYCRDDPDFCDECDYGASMILDENGEETGKCKKCPENCYFCKHSACDECKSYHGKVLDENGEITGECKPCLGKNCRDCDSDYTKCSQCMDGYEAVLGPDGEPTADCAKCPDNCSSCTGNSNVCTYCNYGYGLQYGPNNETVKCAKCIDNCVRCSSNYEKCDQCKSDYYKETDENGFFTGRCIKCPENCASCTDDGKFCTRCNSNYALKVTVKDGVAQSECIKCHESCSECYLDDPTKCISCNEGYRTIFEEKDPTKKCKKCIDNCLSCIDDTTCEKCDDGFGINEELICTKCDDTNCLSCEYDYKYCLKCKDGFNLVSGKCRSCPDNCKNCIFNVDLCSICDDGYGFEIDDKGERTGKCLQCSENCESCTLNSNICALCKKGFGFEIDSSGKQTKNCKQCSEHCLHCNNNADKCIQCEVGFGLIPNQDGTSSGKCGSCPENCLSCDFDDSICTECQPGFGLVITENGGNKIYQCNKCPANCQTCNYDTSKCVLCSQNEDKSYGFEIGPDGSMLNNCVECPSNCKSCYSSKKCLECKDGYVKHYGVDDIATCHHIGETDDDDDDKNPTTPPDTPSDSVIDDDANTTVCLVDGCELCEDGFTDQCAKCNSSLVLTPNKQCIKPLEDITPTPTPKPTYVEPDYDSIENGNMNFNFDDKDLDDGTEQIVLRLSSKENQEKEFDSVTITNTKNKSIAVQIPEGYEEITFKVAENTNSKSFDIIPPSNSNLTINLDPTTHASIIEAEGNISIGSTDNDQSVNLNQIKPKSNLTITPKNSIIIDEIEFSKKITEFAVNSDDNEKVKINSIKVQQLKSGIIQNATILEKITIGLSSSLEINENVKFDDSIVELSYNSEYSQLIEDVAQIKGTINSTPKKIVITERNENEWLSEEKLLIVESEKEFDCNSWGNKIEYIQPFNDFKCDQKSSPYRLYAINKDKSKGNKLGPGAIAGIVVGVVVFVALIVFLLVYFLVIKKKRNISTVSEREEDSVDF